jgi:hypothetical protein
MVADLRVVCVCVCVCVLCSRIRGGRCNHRVAHYGRITCFGLTVGFDWSSSLSVQFIVCNELGACVAGALAVRRVC